MNFITVMLKKISADLFTVSGSLNYKNGAKDVYEDRVSLIVLIIHEIQSILILILILILKSNMYSLVDVDGEVSRKAKGINKSVVMGIKPKEFVDALFCGKLMTHRMKRIKVNCTELELMFFRFHSLVFYLCISWGGKNKKRMGKEQKERKGSVCLTLSQYLLIFSPLKDTKSE